ncbi:SulA-like leucine-rich domain-containing protein [Photobacterium leiognathi]|uniref:SulA-like leucine-rich domain-containing protein n=1 Tax=Photobacterium leiognathi TaxID=553611 RepID=UPI000D15C91F|nr:SulA-like leucine-rich domain-containing protein [Photobacterium leiognathi]PSW66503.1 cell division protein FtsZ [Photobacterium leiognathi subsp. mandapamensis]
MNYHPSITASQVYKSTFTAHSTSLSEAVGQTIEVSYSAEQQTQLAYFLRLLKKANNENRWIMFVGYDALIDKSLLKNAGIDINKVLLLKASEHQSKHNLLVKALEMGNCSAVIVAGDIEQFDTPLVNSAAKNGKAMAFVLNKNLTTHLTVH